MDGYYTLEAIRNIQLRRKEFQLLNVALANTSCNLNMDVTVLTREGNEYVIPMNIARQSELLCTALDEAAANGEESIPLPVVSNNDLQHLIDFYTQAGEFPDVYLGANSSLHSWFDTRINAAVQKGITRRAAYERIMVIIQSADYLGFNAYILYACHYLYRMSFLMNMTERQQIFGHQFFLLPIYLPDVDGTVSETWVETITPSLATIFLQTLFFIEYVPLGFVPLDAQDKRVPYINLFLEIPIRPVQ